MCLSELFFSTIYLKSSTSSLCVVFEGVAVCLFPVRTLSGVKID